MIIPESGPTFSSILKDNPTLQVDGDMLRYAGEYNERYLHWSDLKYREFGQSDRMRVWALMKILRNTGTTRLTLGGTDFMFNLTSEMLRILHEIDTASSSGLVPSDVSDGKRNLVLAASSMMEESIASSQLEGASITTKQAKKILRSNSQPKDIS